MIILPASRSAQIGIGRSFPKVTVTGLPFPSGWSYKKSFPLSRASGAVTNYQMKLIIYRSSGTDSAGVVYVGTKCNSDYSDIRITANDGTTLLDYWIESSDSSSATVWIEFDSIGTSDTTFYLYYGNAGVAAYSSGTNTFIDYDHFDSLSHWDGDTAYASVSSSIVSFKGPGKPAVKLLYSKSTIGQATFAVRTYAKIKAQSGNEDVVGVGQNTRGHEAGIYNNAGSAKLHSRDGSTASTAASNWTSDTWKIWDIYVNANTNVKCYENGVELTGSPKTTNPPNATSMRLWFLSYASGAVLQCDWIFARNWDPTEPTWGSWGAEEAA